MDQNICRFVTRIGPEDVGTNTRRDNVARRSPGRRPRRGENQVFPGNLGPMDAERPLPQVHERNVAFFV